MYVELIFALLFTYHAPCPSCKVVHYRVQSLTYRQLGSRFVVHKDETLFILFVVISIDSIC